MSPAPSHLLLVDVARRAQLPPERLLELAMASPRLQLAVRQARWAYDGVFEATGYGDEPARREAERAVPDEDPPHRLRSGLVVLPPDQIDRLRSGPIEVTRVTELERGLDVHLVGTKQITIDQVWIDLDAWAPAIEALPVSTPDPTLAEIGMVLQRLEARLGSELPEIMTRSQALAALGGRRGRGSWAAALVDSIQIPTGGIEPAPGEEVKFCRDLVPVRRRPMSRPPSRRRVSPRFPSGRQGTPAGRRGPRWSWSPGWPMRGMAHRA